MSVIGKPILNLSKSIQYFTVSYNANGGKNAPAAQTKTEGIDLILSTQIPTHADDYGFNITVTLNPNGGTCDVDKLSTVRKYRYNFTKWSTTASGSSGTNYQSGGTYTADEDVTLYARWTPEGYSNPVTLPTPTRENYTFKGWATKSTATSGITGSFTPSYSHTRYAIWKAN